MICLFFKIGYIEGLQQQASSYTSSSNISVFFRLVQQERIQGRPRATLRAETHQPLRSDPAITRHCCLDLKPHSSFQLFSPECTEFRKTTCLSCHFQTGFVYITRKSTFLKLETFYQKPQVLSVILFVQSIKFLSIQKN